MISERTVERKPSAPISKIAFGAGPVAENRCYAIGLLLDVDERLPEVIVLFRQQVLQGAAKACPRAHLAAHGVFVNDLAALAEAHALRDVDTVRLVDEQSELAHDVEHFVVRGDSRAARGEIVFDALEHIDVPRAHLAQHVRCEQTAERSPDDERAAIPATHAPGSSPHAAAS